MASVNRYTNIQPNRYNPRSLQEMMIAPAYKREQHTAIEDKIAANETALAQVDPLAVHSDAARQEQERLSADLATQAERLQQEGFSPTSKSDFTRLNKDYQQAISPTGTLGKIQAAKLAMTQEKENYIANATAGGLPADIAAANWEDHVRGYTDKYNQSGEISNIDPRYGAKYINVVDEFDKKVKDLGLTSVMTGGTSSSIIFDEEKGSYVQSIGGEHLTADNKKQLDKLNNWIKNQINNPDSEIGRSLKEQRKTSAQALKEIEGYSGLFEKSTKKDIYNDTISNFNPIETTDSAVDAATIRAAEGEANTINGDNIDGVRKNVIKTKREFSRLEKVIDEMKAKGVDKTNPREFELAKDDLNTNRIKYQNLERRLDFIKKESIKTANLSDKDVQFSNYYDTLESTVPNFDVTGSIDDTNYTLFKYLQDVGEIDENESIPSIGINPSTLQKNLQKQVLQHVGAPGINNVSVADMSNLYPAKGRVRDAADDYLKDHGYAESFVDLAGPKIGKYANAIGVINKNLSENIDGVGYSNSYTGESINVYLDKKYGDDEITKETRITNTIGPDGAPMENLIIKNEDGVVLEAIQVTRGVKEGRAEFITAAKTLLNSTSPYHRSLGKQMLVDLEMKPIVTKSDIYGGEDGTFMGINATDNITGESVPIKWERTNDYQGRPVWKIKVGNESSDQLFSEKEITQYLYNLNRDEK